MFTAYSRGAAFAIAVGLTAVAAPGAVKQVDASAVCPTGYDPLIAFCIDERTGDIVSRLDIAKAAGDCKRGSERLGEVCFDRVNGDIENPQRKEAIR